MRLQQLALAYPGDGVLGERRTRLPGMSKRDNYLILLKINKFLYLDLPKFFEMFLPSNFAFFSLYA